MGAHFMPKNEKWLNDEIDLLPSEQSELWYDVPHWEAFGLPVWQVIIWSVAIAKFYPATRVALG